MSDQQAADTSSGNNEQTTSESPSVDEPERKKAKIEQVKTVSFSRSGDKLENRLGGILCCSVCLDLPKSAVYQCTNGHLMCACCFTHLLADARLRDETASCPNCRIEISRSLVSRNLAVENAVCELPARCQHCASELPRASLDTHERQLCDERPVTCMYSVLGCPWRGPAHERPSHQESCPHPSKPGRAVLEALQSSELQRSEEMSRYDSIFQMLSLEKILFNDIQLKPYRTDDFIQKLFYESMRFGAFSHQWVMKARINDSQRDPSHSCQRRLTYQLILKSKGVSSLSLHYVVLPGPFATETSIVPAIYTHEFSEQQPESPFTALPLSDSAACNRLLAARTINIRLILFQSTK